MIHIEIINQSGHYLRVPTKKLIFLFLNQNICCGYSKEPYQRDGCFEHTKHMLELMDKKIFTLLRSKFCLSKQSINHIYTFATLLNLMNHTI